MRALGWVTLFSLGLCSTVVLQADWIMAQEVLSVVEFQSPSGEVPWRVVNDGVMGGLSRSRITVTDEGTALFEGTVSLENNGGFASVRTEPLDFDLGGYEGLSVRVRGDGKRYQLRLRMGRRFDGVAYTIAFDTDAEEWLTVRAPFDECVATFRGSEVPGAPPLVPARIEQIGFLISDSQEGPFRLEIDFIRAYR